MKLFEEDLNKDDMSEYIKIGNTVVGYITMCEKDLTCVVDLGHGRKGTCVHEEIELLFGNKEKAKRIASLGRVGKYTYFKITGIKEDGTYELSRKKVQEEYYNKEVVGTEFKKIFDGRVLRVLEYGIFVDIGFGITGILSRDNFTQAIVENTRKALKDLKKLKVFIRSIDEYRISLGHKELLGDFEYQSSKIEMGCTYTGIVKGNTSYGVFVALDSNLVGLADEYENAKKGDVVSVIVRKINPEARKVKLKIISVVGHNDPNYIDTNFEYLDLKEIPRDWKF